MRSSSKKGPAAARRPLTVAARAVVTALLAGAALLASMPPSAAAQADKAPDWSAWQPLLGEWVGEGGGADAGQGTGGFTYAADLQGRVILRRNHADYPAAQDRPASSHEDLMVIYQEPGAAPRAIYFDNEGHVIRYAASWSKDGRTVTFVSDATPGAPRFRLTQALVADDAMAIRFDVASPSAPDSFQTYLEARAHRKR